MEGGQREELKSSLSLVGDIVVLLLIPLLRLVASGRGPPARCAPQTVSRTHLVVKLLIALPLVALMSATFLNATLDRSHFYG